MYAIIDSEGFYTMQYSDYPNESNPLYVRCERLPEVDCMHEHYNERMLSHKWTELGWVFDQNKYDELIGISQPEQTVEEKILSIMAEQEEMKQKIETNQEMLYMLVDIAMGEEE